MNNKENRYSLFCKFLKIFRKASKKNLQGYALLEQNRINCRIDSYEMILESITE